MRKIIAILIVVAAFVVSIALQQMIGAPDDTITPSVTTECTRLVSLSPGLTETVFALGLGERVAGVTRYCLYPPETQERTRVGGFLDPNYEAIVALRPGMVLVTPYQQELAADLQRLGIATFAVAQDSLADIRESYRIIAGMCDCHEQAETLVAKLDAAIDRMQTHRDEKARPRVLMTTGRDVRSGTLDEVYAVGRDTFLDELLTLAGGENIAPGGALEYPALSGEGILRLDPDIIIELVADRQYDDTLEARALEAWRALPTLRAAQENRIHVLFGAHLTVPGPRVVKTLDALAQCLYADADGAP